MRMHTHHNRVALCLQCISYLCQHSICLSAPAGVMVTPPALPASIPGASHQGRDGPPLADASKAGAGAFAAELVMTRVAAESLVPKPCEGGLCCSAPPTRAGEGAGDAR